MLVHNFLYFLKQWGPTAIYWASAKGHTETVKVLLQAKADTEIQHTVTASSLGKKKYGYLLHHSCICALGKSKHSYDYSIW